MSAAVDVCDSRKLNFNGNYNCSEREDLYMCSLRCPAGMDFSSQPAISYSCDYSEGRFHPSSVPQCVFGMYKNILLSQLYIVNIKI